MAENNNDQIVVEYVTSAQAANFPRLAGHAPRISTGKSLQDEIGDAGVASLVKPKEGRLVDASCDRRVPAVILDEAGDLCCEGVRFCGQQ